MSDINPASQQAQLSWAGGVCPRGNLPRGGVPSQLLVGPERVPGTSLGRRVSDPLGLGFHSGDRGTLLSRMTDGMEQEQ